MLIRGGCIHTMTRQGTFVGDILIRDGKIAELGPGIAARDECVVDAKGLTVLPGLVDAHIQAFPEEGAEILRSQGSGVTAGLFWPEEEGICRLAAAETMLPSRMYVLEPSAYSDARLHERFLALADDGFRVACRIRCPEQCRRVLQVIHSTRVKAILLHLPDCEELLEAVNLAACPVILGVNSSRAGSPWRMVRRLVQLGTAVSVTCSYPQARLCHLPLCAALCAREGMDGERALQTVTTAPAALLGLENAGRIAIGCQADLALYDGDPLLLATSHVMTILSGKLCC